MTVDSVSATAGRSDAVPLRATLEVDPPASAACPIAAAAPNAAAVTRNCTDERCHSEVTVIEEDGSERRYLSGPTAANCVCETIGRFECAFDVDGVRDGSLVIALVVDDRSVLGRIVDELEEIGASVRLRRLSRLADGDDPFLEIDAADITEKQREAAELAVERGYYDRPREADLSDLADELGVSKSAVSQRLTAVELTLVRSLVER